MRWNHILAIMGVMTTLLIAPFLHADTSTTTANVTNEIPVASSAQINGGSAISLSEGTTTTVLGTGTITDNNGCEDIEKVNATLFRTNIASGWEAADDDNDHYTVACVSNSDCSVGGSDLTETYNCTFQVQYYADPTDAGSQYSATDWTFRLEPFDETNGTADTAQVELNTLTALSVNSTINYGVLALGANVSDKPTLVINTGNEAIDLNLDAYGGADGDGTALNCTVGSIDVALQQYNNQSFAWGAGTNTTDTATHYNLSIAQRTGAQSDQSVYWGLKLPATGVGGDCSGTVNMVAVSNT